MVKDNNKFKDAAEEVMCESVKDIHNMSIFSISSTADAILTAKLFEYRMRIKYADKFDNRDIIFNVKE